jgi:hypothetical protein
VAQVTLGLQGRTRVNLLLTGMEKLNYWRCGIIGAIALLGATLIGAPLKSGIYVLRHGWPDCFWYEFVLVLLFVSAAGFACGVVAWSASRLSSKFGVVGDAAAGIAVMVVFFFFCMLAFDRPLLLNPTEALPLWILATVVGIVGGLWCGRDLRNWAKEQTLAGHNSQDDPANIDGDSITDESSQKDGKDRA